MFEVGLWDKPLHVLVSFVLGLIHPALAAAAGLGKEVFDALTGGVFDAFDLLADAAGILISVLVTGG